MAQLFALKIGTSSIIVKNIPISNFFLAFFFYKYKAFSKLFSFFIKEFYKVFSFVQDLFIFFLNMNKKNLSYFFKNNESLNAFSLISGRLLTVFILKHYTSELDLITLSFVYHNIFQLFITQ